MKPLILRTLRLTYAQYDNYRESCFMRWCTKYAMYEAVSLRTLYTHDGLRNWYQTQWLVMVERKFLKEHHDFLQLEDATGELQDLFLTYAPSLEANYPKPLLELIKSEKHESNQQNRSRTQVKPAL
ncbi:MAG TPA: hypothetical protein VL022_04720 [Moheibacter sp.]|nr:hypothetical protein [Moheibacter sp.]